MNEDNEEFEGNEEFFVRGETILVTLSNGDRVIGDYEFETDAGICLHVVGRTAIKYEVVMDEKEIEKKRAGVTSMLNATSLSDLYKMALTLKITIPIQKAVEKTGEIVLDTWKQAENKRRNFVAKVIEDKMMDDWLLSKKEPRKYMRENKRSVKTYIAWHKVDQIESAAEIVEENDMLTGTESELDKLWNQKIDEWKNEEMGDNDGK